MNIVTPAMLREACSQYVEGMISAGSFLALFSTYQKDMEFVSAKGFDNLALRYRTLKDRCKCIIPN